MSSVDDPQWLTFRKYAKRVKKLHGVQARVPLQVKEEFISTLQYCPKTYLPLLPNVVVLGWTDLAFSASQNSDISLLGYFAGPSVITIRLSFMRWLAYSAAELAVLADLPRLCPNVTSFTVALHFSWDYEPSEEIGSMVIQWPGLRTLRTCALSQSVMDRLFSRRTLESLHIDYSKSSPIYIGTLPDTVRAFTLSSDKPSSCTTFLKTSHASPAKIRLLIGMNEREEEADTSEAFSLLPRCVDTSRLLSLTIEPTSSIVGIPKWCTLRLQEPLVSILVEFRALQELDLDLLRTAQMSDADYERLTASLTQLRSLKLGTSNPSITRLRPVATVATVIAVLRHCKQLETLHILFDGSIPPPESFTSQEGDVAFSEKLEWGVSNHFITRLDVGYTPIQDATIHAIASCFRSIMPCLVQIEYQDRDEEWRLVQNILKSYRKGLLPVDGFCLDGIL